MVTCDGKNCKHMRLFRDMKKVGHKYLCPACFFNAGGGPKVVEYT
jgi:hypothetical protein